MNAKNIAYAVTMMLVLAAGIFLRVHPTGAFHSLGSDEGTYGLYLGMTHKVGILHYREVVEGYQAYQAELSYAIVHPLRLTYIVSSYIWMETFRVNPLIALHHVSSFAAVLNLLLAGFFAWRLGGKSAALGVLALVAFAPLQVSLAQRALVDGYYAFLTTLSFWLLWENLRAPNRWGWLAAYTFSLTLLVLTKEYSAFVVFAFCVIMGLNRWLDFGTVTPKLLAGTVIGPALAVLILMCLAGGPSDLIQFYRDFIEKSRTLDYAIKMQDGPWTRYMLDFLIVSPAVLLLAVGRVFQLSRANRPDLFCALFLIACYIPMTCVTYGLSLRFAAFWDFPLCWLAWSLLRALSERLFINRKTVALAVAVVLVCGIELREYSRIFIEFDDGQHQIYDPITENLLQADKILK